MSRRRFPGDSGRPFGLKPVCEVLSFPRSTVYAFLKGQHEQTGTAKRGPRPQLSDQELAEMVKQDIQASAFVGEGHRKIWAQMEDAKLA